nr:hypothetical protein [Tanacetum cinerariifolium]
VDEFGVLRQAVSVACKLGFAGGGHVGDGLAVEEANVLLPVWVVKGLRIPERGVLARDRCIVLNGKVVSIQVVQIEGAAQWVGRREKAEATNGGG